MKARKIVYIIIMIIVVIGLMAGVVMLLKREQNVNSENATGETNILEQINVIYTAHYSSIHSVYSDFGEVTSNEEEYIDTYILEYDNETHPSVKIEAGQEIEKHQTLYEYKNKAYASDSAGIVTEIKDKNNILEIRILNFEKQYIEFLVPYKFYSNINYASKVVIQEDGKETDGEIIQLGYVVNNDMVSIKIGFDKYIMPGRKVNVSIDIGNTKEMLILPVQAVFGVDSDRYCYVYDEEAETIERVTVTLGDIYTEISDGNEFQYYEILSGLSDGDKVVELK